MVFFFVCVCAWYTGAQDEGSSGTTVCHAPTEAIRVSFVGCHLKCGAHMNREAVWAFRENMVTLSYRYELSLKVHLWGSKAPGKPQVTGTPLLWLQSVFLQRLARTMLRLLVIKNFFFQSRRYPSEPVLVSLQRYSAQRGLLPCLGVSLHEAQTWGQITAPPCRTQKWSLGLC